MRDYPDMNNENDVKQLKRLKAENWMLGCLKMNPSYNCWGNYEDYMIEKDEGLEFDNTSKGLWELNDYNELVNFYFEICRASRPCVSCNQSGHNPATKRISDDWYDFGNTGRKWRHNITQDEVDALWEHNRLRGSFTTKPTAEQVNEWNKSGMGHDAINRWICVETRAKRLGVWGKCEHCEGSGSIFTEDKAKLALQLWWLHPREGCSQGVYIKSVQREDLPKVIELLKSAAIRNAERFAKLNSIPDEILPYFIIDKLMD